MDPKCKCAFSAFSPHRQSKCALNGNKNKKKDQEGDAVIAKAVEVENKKENPTNSNIVEKREEAATKVDAPTDPVSPTDTSPKGPSKTDNLKTGGVAVAKGYPCEDAPDASSDNEDEEGDEDLGVLGALALAGAIGMGAVGIGAYLFSSGNKTDEKSALEAPAADGPIIDSVPPQDLTSVTAITGDAYYNRRCGCSMSQTFPHRIRKCLWKNFLLGPNELPAKADAQAAGTDDNLEEAAAVAVDDSASCADTDVTALMQANPMAMEESETPTTLRMEACSNTENESLDQPLPVASALLPGPAPTTAVMHRSQNVRMTNITEEPESKEDVLEGPQLDNRSAQLAPCMTAAMHISDPAVAMASNAAAGSAESEPAAVTNTFVDDYLDMLCIASRDGDPVVSPATNRCYVSDPVGVVHNSNHTGNSNVLTAGELCADFDQGIGYIDDDTISTITMDDISQSTQSTQYTFCQPITR